MLLDRLPPCDRQGLLHGTTPIQLRAGEELSTPGQRFLQVYFPLDCAISLVTTGRGHPRVEVGLIGREGMLGMPAILGTGVSGLRAVVEIPGQAWRVDARRLDDCLQSSEGLRARLNRYVHARLLQVAEISACGRFHRVEGRLARWLSMARDRAADVELAMTHEHLSSMLGVRRAGVSQAASELQRRGLIRYCRGHVTVRDRSGLARAACDCYDVEKEIYARVMG
jgi:CRP-like cAMP-binding protein